MKTFDSYLAEKLKDPEFKKEYAVLKKEHENTEKTKKERGTQNGCCCKRSNFDQTH